MQIATTLTAIEDMIHNSIGSADYILHLRNSDYHDRIAKAILTEKRMCLWAKQEILARHKVEERGKVLNTFLNTADVSGVFFIVNTYICILLDLSFCIRSAISHLLLLSSKECVLTLLNASRKRWQSLAARKRKY